MDKTIDMAREANLAKYGDGLREGVYAFIDALKAFEALVRADERARLHPKKIKAVQKDEYCQGDERYYAND
jgi:hypothetical protein